MTFDPALIADEFPGARGQVYFNCAARGLVPRRARAAVDTILDQRMDGSTDKDAAFALIERVRTGFARMINAEPDEVAMTKNVSEGLNAIAAALDAKPGDNVVLCPALEHPNNVYPWLHLRERLGIEVRTVEPRDGHMPVEEMVAAMDDRTCCVAVASVSFSPGFRTDLAPLGRACRKREAFFLVDAVQSVGIVETDVRALGIDGLAVSTQKGLCGLYGMGLLYCRRERAERMTPVYLARFGVDLGAAHEASMGTDNYRLMPGARRFDLGNHNYIGAAAAAESIELLNEIGTGTIESHVGALTRRLAQGMLDLGLPVAGGAPGPHLTSILCVGRHGAGGGHDSAADSEMTALSAHFTENRVQHSIRRGLIRLSLHLYNTDADVDHALELAQDWLRRRRAAYPRGFESSMPA